MQEGDPKRKAGWWSRLMGAEAEAAFESQQQELTRLEEALSVATQRRAADEDRARERERERDSLTQAAARSTELRFQAEAALQEAQQRLSGVEALHKHLRDEYASERKRFDEQRAEWERARAAMEAEAASLRTASQETSRKAEAQRMVNLRDMEAVRASVTRERERFNEALNEQLAAAASAEAKAQALQDELARERGASAAAKEEHDARERRSGERVAELTAAVARHERAATAGAAELERLRAALAESQKAAAAAQLAARGQLAQIELLTASAAAEKERAAAASTEVATLRRELEEAREAVRVEQERAAAAQRRQAEESARVARLTEQLRGRQSELDEARASRDEAARARDEALRQVVAARQGGEALFRVALRALRMSVGERAGLPLRAALAAEAAASPDGADGYHRALGEAGFDPALAAAPQPVSVEALAAWWASVLAGRVGTGPLTR